MPGTYGNSVVPCSPLIRFLQPTSGGSVPPTRSTFQTPSSSLITTTSRVPPGAWAKRPLPADGSGAREGAPGRRRLAVRAEVGRLSRRAGERRRRPRALVAERAPAAPLLPRAPSARRSAAAALRARRRDRDRARRRARLRLDADAPASGRVQGQEALGRDTRRLRRLRRPPVGRQTDLQAAARGTSRRARANR